MSNKHSDELIGQHIDAFVSQFMHKPFRQRWRTVLHMDPIRWNALKVTDFKSSEVSNQELCREVSLCVVDLAQVDIIKPYLDQECVLLQVGMNPHRGATIITVREALAAPLEKIISIVCGELVIVMDHDDHVVICNAKR